MGNCNSSVDSSTPTILRLPVRSHYPIIFKICAICVIVFWNRTKINENRPGLTIKKLLIKLSFEVLGFLLYEKGLPRKAWVSIDSDIQLGDNLKKPRYLPTTLDLAQSNRTNPASTIQHSLGVFPNKPALNWHWIEAWPPSKKWSPKYYVKLLLNKM